MTNSSNANFGEVFLLETSDADSPLYFKVFDEKIAPENLLGSFSVSLYELKVDRSGEGIPTTVLYNLVRGPLVTQVTSTLPKIQVSFCYILKNTPNKLSKDTLEREPLTSSASKNNGWKRGNCIISDCECKSYQSESEQGGACQSCGHWPAQHINLSAEEPFEPPQSELDIEDTNEKDMEQLVSFSTKYIISSKPNTVWGIKPSDIKFSKRLGDGPLSYSICGLYAEQEVVIKCHKQKVHSKALEEYKKEFEIFK